MERLVEIGGERLAHEYDSLPRILLVSVGYMMRSKCLSLVQASYLARYAVLSYALLGKRGDVIWSILGKISRFGTMTTESWVLTFDFV